MVHLMSTKFDEIIAYVLVTFVLNEFPRTISFSISTECSECNFSVKNCHKFRSKAMVRPLDLSIFLILCRQLVNMKIQTCIKRIVVNFLNPMFTQSTMSKFDIKNI